MTAAGGDLPRLVDLPIPHNVRPDRSWSDLMLHLAAHIGPRATLMLCEKHGGREVAISAGTVRRFADVLTEEEMTRLAAAFGRERVTIPIGSRAILHAKRAGIVAAVRANKLTAADAAVICRTPRRYMAHLVNQTKEGTDDAPVVPRPTIERDPRQLDLLSLLDD